MKALALAILLSAASLPGFESAIDGKWMTEMHMDSKDGRSYTNKTTFVLKNEGGVLTGTVGMYGKTVDISDGKFDGDKFTFRVSFEGNKGVKTLVYDGTVEGDSLKGELKVRGIGQVWPFEAKRVQ